MLNTSEFSIFIDRMARLNYLFDRQILDGSVLAEPDRRTGLFAIFRYSHDLLDVNHKIWVQEDVVRQTPDEDTSAIVKAKRAIDKYNQQRNDIIESIDAVVLSYFSRVILDREAFQYTETVGSIIDRLSICTLKIKYMKAQTLRIGVEKAHTARCSEKAEILSAQRDDLLCNLVVLLKGFCKGTHFFKVFRQFKMYNDPSMFPDHFG